MAKTGNSQTGDGGFDKRVGRRIINSRDVAGLSQIDVAEKLRARGVPWSQAILSKVERGDRPLRFEEALVLAQVLGLPLEELSPASPMLDRFRRENTAALVEAEGQLKTALWSYVQRSTNADVLDMLRTLGEDRESRFDCSGDAVDLVYLAEGMGEWATAGGKIYNLVSLVDEDLEDQVLGRLEAAAAAEGLEFRGTGPLYSQDGHAVFTALVDDVVAEFFCETFPNVRFGVEMVPPADSPLAGLYAWIDSVTRPEDFNEHGEPKMGSWAHAKAPLVRRRES